MPVPCTACCASNYGRIDQIKRKKRDRERKKNVFPARESVVPIVGTDSDPIRANHLT